MRTSSVLGLPWPIVVLLIVLVFVVVLYIVNVPLLRGPELVQNGSFEIGNAQSTDLEVVIGGPIVKSCAMPPNRYSTGLFPAQDARRHAFGDVAGMICDSTRGNSQHEVAAERLANIKLALLSGVDEVNRSAAPVS
jgi:hypothetical protein